jgi:hypothetical protein
MDSLPTWAVSIIAVAIGLSPGIALLAARPIGRFLRRKLLARSSQLAAQKVSQGELDSKPIKERGNGRAFGSALAVRGEGAG